MKLVLVQALRALAALLVVVHHAQPEAAAIAARGGAAFYSIDLLPWTAGVDIFFVISGFIIVHASSPLYGRRGGRRRFLAHRIARLVPLYWLVTSAYLVIAVASPGVLSGGAGLDRLDPAYVAASYLFWPAARADGAALPLYGLGWTLNYEMLFYVLFAIGLGWGRRAALACLVASLSLLTIAKLALPDLPLPLAFWANPIILEFALGAVLGLARAEGMNLGAGVRLSLALIGFAALAVVPAPDEALRPLAFGLPAALLVAAAALGRETQGEMRTTLAIRWIAALGDASYALYLVHPFALRATREAIVRIGLAPAIDPWLALGIMIIFAVAVSLVVHRFLERPLTRYVRRVLDSSQVFARRESGGIEQSVAHRSR